MEMSMKSARFPMSSSSDSEYSEQSGAEETDSSTIVTSFESQVSARDYYKKGPKKYAKNIETDKNKSRAAMLESVRRSPRGKQARPSTLKRPGSYLGKKDKPSTSKGLESPRGKKARPSTSKGPENSQTKRGRPKKIHSKSKRPESPRVKKVPSTPKGFKSPRVKKVPSTPKEFKSPQKGRHETPRKGEKHSRGRSVDVTRKLYNPKILSEHEPPNETRTKIGVTESSERRNDNSLIREEVPPSVPSGSKRRKSGMPRRRGNRAIMEIKQCQRETKLLLAKLPFARVVRQIADQYLPGLRWQVLAIEALQEASEMYLVHLFEDSVLCTIHRSRVTLNVRDMRLAKRIRTRFEDF